MITLEQVLIAGITTLAGTVAVLWRQSEAKHSVVHKESEARYTKLQQDYDELVTIILNQNTTEEERY